MKVKFVKDRYGYKAGETHEVEKADAVELVAKGYAEEISDSADTEKVLNEALDKRDAQLKGEVEKMLAEHTAKVAKGVSKIRPTIVVGNDNLASDPQGGFTSFGEFARDIVNMHPQMGGHTSEKMAKYQKATKGAAATANTEGNAPDAGPTVPVQYTSNIFSITGDIPNFMDLAFKLPMSSNFVKVPVLKNYNRANATAGNGVVAGVVSEGAAITPSKSNWEQLSLTLAKESVLVPVSSELLEDNIVALDAVLAKHSSYQITKAINRGIIQGNSALTGIIGHAATKAISRGTGNTISFADVMAMYAAFNHDDSNFDSSVWFCHPTAIPQLAGMTSGNYNVYTPPGGAQNTRFDKLLGRPLIVTGQCGSLGDNDLILADMSKYVIGYKGGLNAVSSIHLYFDADEVAFRFTMRLNGKPGLSGLITLEDGSTTVSPFVNLVGTTGS